jgi:transketolase
LAANINNKSRKDMANAIRALSIDAIDKANSGHPGMPLGMADIAQVLWSDYLNYSPKNPNWINRDRFVLSNGHGSMLLYSLLHLTGYDLSLDEIKNFRQLHSKTPGHPESHLTDGVETTTGPLGQGLANAVGMAIAEKTLAATYNKKNFKIIDHNTYVFAGDGCLMEGISHEVCSLAGTLKLNKLIVFYDDNGISIDGKVDGWFTDDTVKRFKSYNWNVIADVDGHSSNDLINSIERALTSQDQPTLICCKTKIGFGSPSKEGTASSHGAPFGDKETNLTKESLGWEHGPFEIPDDIYSAWNRIEKGSALENQWGQIFDKYKIQYPNEGKELERRLSAELPDAWIQSSQNFIKSCNEKKETIATRKASQNSIEAYAKVIPEMMGGSADLAASNLTMWSGSKEIKEFSNGNYINYGVREFGMSAIMNGLSAHGGFIPYGGTFLTFSDYAKNAIRMSAIMNLKNIYVFTHDSIGLGEDGPTHQSIEHINSLRDIPNNTVIRPCDTLETAVAWKYALENKGPTCLVLSRQNCEFQNRTSEQIALINKGAYILKDSDNIDIILIATGSEIGITMKASEDLESKGINTRVVSMLSAEIFDKQDITYKEEIFPPTIENRISIEAGSTSFWYKYVGLKGKVLGIDTFGESAPGNELLEYFGFTSQNIVEHAEIMLKK